MKILNRNKQKFWYCLYDSTSTVTDEYGNETGDKVLYKEGVAMYANISPATGLANTEQFGNLDDYDKVIVTDDISCPIDEQTVLFIDKLPEYVEPNPPAQTGTRAIAESPATCEPIYDYIVKRVAKSINSISIAVAKVKVT